MKSLIFLGPGVRFDARQRYGKDRAEYIFWSPDARQAVPGAQVDLASNIAPWGEAGKAREVTNDEAEDLLSFPGQSRTDFQFVEAGADAPSAGTPLETAPATPRSPEEIQAEVARELAPLPAAEVVAMEESTVENKRRAPRVQEG